MIDFIIDKCALIISDHNGENGLNSSHGAFLMHDTAPTARDYLNCLSDFRRDIVMWSCSYLAYAT